MARMDLTELVNREAARSVAQVAASEATSRRNEAIVELLDAGVRQADIARALRVTGGRVWQIAASARARAAA